MRLPTISLALGGMIAALDATALSAQQAVPTPPPVAQEFRASWVAAVANIDWPSRPGLPAAQQRTELLAILDLAAAMRQN
ncbi:MAG TPA: hypothetical protein VFT96_06465, partial [Gemmatimonadaceae bacterium]|nr:hypothetical protein [Gemmatimonadaceae bacterium]